MLRIADLTFEVADASLEGTLSDGRLLWSVSLETAAKRIDGLDWKPHAYLDLYPAPSRSFADLMEIGWSIPSARELSGGRLLPGQANCGLYLFEHDFLEDSRLRFEARDEGVVLTWTGRCSLHWNKRYGSDLAFSAETPIEFLGFWVPAASEREARRLMEPVFDLANLEYHREPDKEGSYFLPPAREE